MMPEAGAVTEDRPNWFQSWVPGHSVVVVGTFNCVTFCAIADVANARTNRRHSRLMRAVSCANCVLVFLIDIRLSRPEARASGTIAMESAAGAASWPSIRACLLMGVLKGHGQRRVVRNHVPV